jgi:hypothetical protein
MADARCPERIDPAGLIELRKLDQLGKGKGGNREVQRAGGGPEKGETEQDHHGPKRISRVLAQRGWHQKRKGARAEARGDDQSPGQSQMTAMAADRALGHRHGGLSRDHADGRLNNGAR